MFRFMVRILPNNRILVRDNEYKTSKTMRAAELSGYFEEMLKEQIEAQEAEDLNKESIGLQLKKIGVRG